MAFSTRLEERRLRYRAMASFFDFVGVIGCAFLLVALVALIGGLYTWFVGDLAESFQSLAQSMTEALMR